MYLVQANFFVGKCDHVPTSEILFSSDKTAQTTRTLSPFLAPRSNVKYWTSMQWHAWKVTCAHAYIKSAPSYTRHDSGETRACFCTALKEQYAGHLKKRKALVLSARDPVPMVPSPTSMHPPLHHHHPPSTHRKRTTHPFAGAVANIKPRVGRTCLGGSQTQQRLDWRPPGRRAAFQTAAPQCAHMIWMNEWLPLDTTFVSVTFPRLRPFMKLFSKPNMFIY